MKIKTILKSRATLEKLFSLETSGATALKLRREIKPFKIEIENYEEVKNNFIKEHGRDLDDGQKGLKPGDDSWPKLVTLLNEMDESEAEISVDVKLNEEDLESATLSALDIDNLISLELLEE